MYGKHGSCYYSYTEGFTLEKHNYQTTKKYARLANNLLDEHKLSPSPINYSILYLYCSKTYSKLTIQVDLLLQTQGLNDTALNSLYEEHVLQVDKLDEEVLSPLSESIGNMLNKLELQLNSEEKAVNDLQKIDQSLASKVTESSIKENSLQQIVNYVQHTVNESVQKHKALSTQISNTNSEINELKSKLSEAKKEAISDALTGFLNRRGCDIKLAELDIEDVHSSLVIDIDHFKSVNDNFGHQIGDKVIQKVAHSIQSQLSEEDIAVRYGGEEFLVVAVNQPIEKAVDVAERIRLAIGKLKLKQKNSDNFLPQISVSIGISDTKNNEHWKHVIEKADKALYQAKNSGRNCVKTIA